MSTQVYLLELDFLKDPEVFEKCGVMHLWGDVSAQTSIVSVRIVSALSAQGFFFGT